MTRAFVNTLAINYFTTYKATLIFAQVIKAVYLTFKKMAIVLKCFSEGIVSGLGVVQPVLHDRFRL